MKRIQIDLPEDVHTAMIEQAAQHGHRLKPFLEFIISVQAGHVPPPQVQPVKMQPAQAAPAQATAKSAPAQAQPERKPEQVKPVESRSQVAPEQAQPSAAPKKRDLSKFNEKVSAQVFTDGQEFMLNRFGKRTFYSTAEEAETARAGSI
jgi:hypothetical protein